MYKPKITSSGSLKLDRLLGIGGFPFGCFVEIYGETSVGKSSLALSSVRSYGKETAYVDTEHRFDLEYAKKMGVLPGNVILLQSSDPDDIISFCREMITAGVRYLVIDSVECLDDKGINHYSVVYRLLSKLSALLGNNTLILLINQMRMDLRTRTAVACGGPAPKFYPVVSMELSKLATIRDEEQFVGYRSKIDITKHRFGQLCTDEIEIYYGKGIDQDIELIEMATEAGIVDKEGNWYKYRDLLLGNGKFNTAKKLAELPLHANVLAAVRSYYHLE